MHIPRKFIFRFIKKYKNRLVYCIVYYINPLYLLTRKINIRAFILR